MERSERSFSNQCNHKRKGKECVNYSFANYFVEVIVIDVLSNLASVNGIHTIKGQKYNLKVHGKTVCPRAFAALYGISINTLNNLSQSDAPLPPEHVSAMFELKYHSHRYLIQ
jgi:hypothetical protein